MVFIGNRVWDGTDTGSYLWWEWSLHWGESEMALILARICDESGRCTEVSLRWHWYWLVSVMRMVVALRWVWDGTDTGSYLWWEGSLHWGESEMALTLARICDENGRCTEVSLRWHWHWLVSVMRMVVALRWVWNGTDTGSYLWWERSLHWGESEMALTLARICDENGRCTEVSLTWHWHWLVSVMRMVVALYIVHPELLSTETLRFLK